MRRLAANLPSFPNIALGASRAFWSSWPGRAEQTRRFWSDIAGWSDKALLALEANSKRAGRADSAPGIYRAKWASGPASPFSPRVALVKEVAKSESSDSSTPALINGIELHAIDSRAKMDSLIRINRVETQYLMPVSQK